MSHYFLHRNGPDIYEWFHFHVKHFRVVSVVAGLDTESSLWLSLFLFVSFYRSFRWNSWQSLELNPEIHGSVLCYKHRLEDLKSRVSLRVDWGNPSASLLILLNWIGGLYLVTFPVLSCPLHCLWKALQQTVFRNKFLKNPHLSSTRVLTLLICQVARVWIISIRHHPWKSFLAHL